MRTRLEDMLRPLIFVTLCLGIMITADTKYKLFHQIPSPDYGPYRLDLNWTDNSLTSCIASCMKRYPTTCRSVMYNNTTKLCTPGKWLNYTEAPPSHEEGNLYRGYDCDKLQNFSLYAYQETPACIMMSKQSVNYSTAEASCKRLNANLYTMKSLDKFLILQSLLSARSWIGLKDLPTDGVYEWSDGDQLTDLTLSHRIFAAGEPNNNNGSQYCVEIRYLLNEGYVLNDQNCLVGRGFVCEKPV